MADNPQASIAGYGWLFDQHRLSSIISYFSIIREREKQLDHIRLCDAKANMSGTEAKILVEQCEQKSTGSSA
jgi:hypothetical protein